MISASQHRVFELNLILLFNIYSSFYLLEVQMTYDSNLLSVNKMQYIAAKQEKYRYTSYPIETCMLTKTPQTKGILWCPRSVHSDPDK